MASPAIQGSSLPHHQWQARDLQRTTRRGYHHKPSVDPTVLPPTVSEATCGSWLMMTQKIGDCTGIASGVPRANQTVSQPERLATKGCGPARPALASQSSAARRFPNLSFLWQRDERPDAHVCKYKTGDGRPQHRTSETPRIVYTMSTSPQAQLSNIRSVGSYINAREAHDESELLAQIGYKEELKRNMSPLQVFGIAFSIMGLLPSIASTMIGGLAGGPATLLWGWFIGGIFIVGIGYCMSELASAIPTSGGLYYWTYHYAPEKWKSSMSFVIGVSNSLALAGGLCSITYGFAVQILSAVFINRDNDFDITNGIIYGVFAAGIAVQLLICCLASGVVTRLQTTSIIANNVLIIIFFIALPIGTARTHGFNDGKFIFAHFENLTSWTDGWAFLQMGIMPVVWTIGAFDSCVHMSEECKDPSRSVPHGIMGSITGCWILGFLIIIVMNACMIPDVDRLISTPSGQPLTQLFYDSLGKNWAVAFISLTAFCQFLMGCSIMTAISRQIWAFARDDGFPFHSFVKVVNKRMGVPLRAVVASAIVSLLIGLLILVGSVASGALFSIAVIGNYVAWGTPQLLRITSGRGVFTPGKFYHGPRISLVVNIVTLAWMMFVIVLAMFPNSKQVDKDTMNYSVVINCGIWILGALYYALYKKKFFHGPKSNLDEEYLEAHHFMDHIDSKLDQINGDVEKA